MDRRQCPDSVEGHSQLPVGHPAGEGEGGTDLLGCELVDHLGSASRVRVGAMGCFGHGRVHSGLVMGDLALMGFHDRDNVSAESTEIDRRQDGSEKRSRRNEIEIGRKVVGASQRLLLEGGAGQLVEVIVTLPRKELD
jgi:hypothetical protein